MIDIPSLPDLWMPPKPKIVRAAELPAQKRLGAFAPGFVARRPAAILPTATLTAHPVDSSGSSSYTFNSQSIGAADSTRYVVVFVARGAVTVTGVTANGNAMTQLTSGTRGDWFGLAIPTGTTANFVVSCGATSTNCSLQIFPLINLNSTTPVNFNTVNSSTAGSALSCNVNTSAGGVALGGVACASSTNRTFTWGGLTEQNDETVDSGTATHGCALANNTSASTPLAVTCTVSGGTTNGHTIATISFR